MKVRVLQNFKDKKTGKRREKGSVITVSQKRYEEILEKGKYVEKVEKEEEDNEESEN